ncbi:MAG: hypothetical protein AB9M53_00995 [Leptothrix sp. (in: b-proteobacteria)]
MAIGMVLRVAAGAALRVFLTLPTGALAWRLLRKVADTFTGPTDPDALVVHAGTSLVVLDDTALINGTPVWYRAYYWNGLTWTASTSVTATPQASYQDDSTDALTVFRDRLEEGLLVEVQRNALQHETGAIPVLTAPPVFDDIRWPLVTVHLSNEADGQRWIGENATGDDNDVDLITGGSVDSEGYMATVQLTVMGWSLNPDERKELRKAIRRVLLANFTVFDAHGIVNVGFNQQDTEDFQSYSAPVYQVMTTINCMAPILVSAAGAPAVVSVTQTITTP